MAEEMRYESAMPKAGAKLKQLENAIVHTQFLEILAMVKEFGQNYASSTVPKGKCFLRDESFLVMSNCRGAPVVHIRQKIR